MAVNTTLLRSCLETFSDPAWWYNRIVEHYAEGFWLAGGGDLLINTIEAVRRDCQIPPLSDNLSRRLAGIYPAPYDQYRLTVSLAASTLWHHGHSRQLLHALHALVTDGPPPPPPREPS